MRDFDTDFRIESIGKKMPYAAPDKDFFEKITTQTLAHAKQEQRRRITLRRLMVSASPIAAAIIVALVITLAPTSRPTYEEEFTRLDLALDAYFEELSDDEISTIATLSDTEIIQYIN